DALGKNEDTGCGNTSSYIYLSEYYAGSPITVTYAKMRVFYRTSSLAAWPNTIDTISTEYERIRCGTTVTITVGASSQDFKNDFAAGCAISALPSFPITKAMLQSDVARYSDDWRFVDIGMEIKGTDVNATMRVRSSNA